MDSETIIVPVLEDFRPNKESALSFVKRKYKLCGYEKKNELQIQLILKYLVRLWPKLPLLYS